MNRRLHVIKRSDHQECMHCEACAASETLWARLPPESNPVPPGTVSCGARRAGHSGAETADLAPVMLPEHRDLRQIEVREPASVVRWTVGLG